MKMLERAFAQYGREIKTAPLPVDDSARLYENLQKARKKIRKQIGMSWLKIRFMDI
ncbi:hypothetical protein LRR81_03410 [Metabacillus sp. GX 13764]|nr:hypothetical protein [Metabacillus kandeliae]MCD7033265.1 hypothetical protein [Metabacillus kandeliae]